MRIVVVILALLLSVPVGARPPVILLSIDGLRPDHVLEADRLGLRIPTLRRLVQEGAYARRVRTCMPSLTYPGHVTLVTGVAPDRHGIVNNQPFDPMQQNQRGWYWYAEDIRVPTLWDVAGQAGLRVGSVDWPVTVGARIPWLISQFWRASTREDNKLLRALSTPGLLAEAEKVLGPYPVNAEYDLAGDRRRAAFGAYVLRHKRPDLFLGYLGALDHQEHHSGPFNRESLAVLEEIDGLVSQLWQTALEIGGGQAVLAVVSDHGFAPLQRGVFLNAILRQEGLITVAADGKVQSWHAFTWNALGCGAVMFAPDCPADQRSQVWRLLQDLARDPDSGIGQILGGSGIRRLQGFPDADLVVLMKPGYGLYGDLSPGPLVRPVEDSGTHGYSPDLPEMDASFFIHGPGVPRGQDLGQIDARDVAPTVAGALGLKMAEAEGRDLLAHRKQVERAEGPSR